MLTMQNSNAGDILFSPPFSILDFLVDTVPQNDFKDVARSVVHYAWKAECCEKLFAVALEKELGQGKKDAVLRGSSFLTQLVLSFLQELSGTFFATKLNEKILSPISWVSLEIDTEKLLDHAAIEANRDNLKSVTNDLYDKLVELLLYETPYEIRCLLQTLYCKAARTSRGQGAVTVATVFLKRVLVEFLSQCGASSAAAPEADGSKTSNGVALRRNGTIAELGLGSDSGGKSGGGGGGAKEKKKGQQGGSQKPRSGSGCNNSSSANSTSGLCGLPSARHMQLVAEALGLIIDVFCFRSGAHSAPYLHPLLPWATGIAAGLGAVVEKLVLGVDYEGTIPISLSISPAQLANSSQHLPPNAPSIWQFGFTDPEAGPRALSCVLYHMSHYWAEAKAYFSEADQVRLVDDAMRCVPGQTASPVANLQLLPTSPVVLFSGWVTKEGFKVKNWKKRFLVMTLEKLMYFTVDDTAYANMRGEILFRSITAIHRSPRKNSTIVLAVLGRNYRLSFLTPEELVVFENLAKSIFAWHNDVIAASSRPAPVPVLPKSKSNSSVQPPPASPQPHHPPGTQHSRSSSASAVGASVSSLASPSNHPPTTGPGLDDLSGSEADSLESADDDDPRGAEILPPSDSLSSIPYHAGDDEYTAPLQSLHVSDSDSDDDVAAALPENVVKLGWITKQGYRVRNWKRRFLVLTDYGQLLYYTSHCLTPANLKGSISLAHVTFVGLMAASNKSDAGGGRKGGVFAVDVEWEGMSRRYLLECGEGRGVAADWVAAIERVRRKLFITPASE